jgi:hypothetical protein
MILFSLFPKHVLRQVRITLASVAHVGCEDIDDVRDSTQLAGIIGRKQSNWTLNPLLSCKLIQLYQ